MTQPNEEKALTKITNYMEAPIVKARFANMMGERGASTYINSILLAVAESQSLQKCTPVSIYTQALRAATLRLSVDPGIGQAYMVPFGARATLIVGYKGLHDMAVRTGKYRYINVGPVYEGEEVIEDRITGFHRLAGHKAGDKIVGWLGAFEMTNGYAKTLYMPVDEIHAHAKQYSKSYGDPKSPWTTETPKMDRKTVLRLLLRRWGYIDPSDVQILDEIEEEPTTIEGEFNAIESELEKRAPEEKRTEAQNLHDLGFETNPDPVPAKERDAYLALCNQAETLDIPYTIPDWNKTTLGDLRQEAASLTAIIKDIEAQNAAESAPQ